MNDDELRAEINKANAYEDKRIYDAKELTFQFWEANKAELLIALKEGRIIQRDGN